jgi:imidazolonepropionase
MPVLVDIGLLATPEPGARQGVLRVIPDAAIAWRDGRITWLGPRSLLPPDAADGPTHSAGHGLAVPGLIDCHTHLAFGGWRADEFEPRILGRSYAEIAQAGGGILRTVALTRETSTGELTARCFAHLEEMRRLGVTTVECKSGYGLDVEHELRLLRVYGALALAQPVRVIPTFLAHTIPEEYRDRRDAFVRFILPRVIREAATEQLARFCDVFVETTAFSLEEARTVLAAGAAHGLRAKVHADQLSDGGGAALAADVGAISADHLECISEDGIRRLAAASTVAVSLPLCAVYLDHEPLPARRLLEAGVRVAVATDFNPGTAPSYHLPLAMMLACTVQRMTPSESLWGATHVAAAALGLEREVGLIAPGHRADLAIIDAPDVDHWLYHFRPNACVQTWIGGARVH